jgi:hypothetical protein
VTNSERAAPGFQGGMSITCLARIVTPFIRSADGWS